MVQVKYFLYVSNFRILNQLFKVNVNELLSLFMFVFKNNLTKLN
jgi:hypothetical protein